MPIKPKRVSHSELVKILESGDTTRLFGVMETEQIDFKESPYILDNSGKKDNYFEIAKDVAAIANSRQGGGIICIGVEEEKQAGNVSVAKAVHCFDKKLINEDALRKIIINGIFPHPKDDFIEFKYYTIDGSEVFGIHIKETPQTLFPLLAIKSDGSEIEYFLSPFRPGARTAALLKRDRIHHYIKKGLDDESKAPRMKDLQRIEKKIDLILNKCKEPAGKPEETEEENLIDYAKQKLDLSKGFFYLQAIPENDYKVKNFFDDKPNNKTYKLLLNPPKLRNSGWDLQIAVGYGELPQFINNRWESSNGNAKLIIVKDNLEVFAAGTISDFLDWGVKDYHLSEKYKGELINNFALVEFVDRFVAFLDSLIKQYNFKSDYELKVGFILPDGIDINLFRPFHLGVYFRDIVGIQTGTAFTTTFEGKKPKEVKYAAGQIVAELYAKCFGENDPPLAYLGRDGNGWFVDEDRFHKAN